MKKIAFVIAFLFTWFYEDACETCNYTNPCKLEGKGGENLSQPLQKISSNGTLTITLNVDVTVLTYDWLSIFRRTYNGQIPGPTWRVKRGDIVTLIVNNNLKYPFEFEPFNELRDPNITNIHTHGLHISSISPQDNVTVKIKPGESYIYEYHIDPENPAGTFWYHPHFHGSTKLQTQGGMAGMLIIEDPTSGYAAPPDKLAAVSCPNNCQHEIQLVFQAVLVYGNPTDEGYPYVQNAINDNPLFRQNQYITQSGETLEAWLTDNIDYYTTNGQLFPTLTVNTGQLKRFRMVNAGVSANLELLIVDEGTLTPSSGCTFKEIAFDGIYLNEARSARLGKTLLFPSSRADWLVVCNNPGTYEVRSVPDPRDEASMGEYLRFSGLLFTIKATGPVLASKIPMALPTRELFVSDFRHLSQEEVEGRYVIEVNSGQQLNRAKYAGPADKRFKSRVNSVQEWYFTNTDPTRGHPIHIHINHFQVISYNKYTGPVSTISEQNNNLIFYSQDKKLCYYQSALYEPDANATLPKNHLRYLGHDKSYALGGIGTLGYVTAGEFRDVIMVPPLSNITIRFKTHKYVGDVVLHCHILIHEDLGMMLTTEVVNRTTYSEIHRCNALQDALLNAELSGGAAPGQCDVCDPFPFNRDVSNCKKRALRHNKFKKNTFSNKRRKLKRNTPRWTKASKLH